MSRTEEKFVATPVMNGYLPVLDLINFNSDESVRFTDGKNVSNDIITYNKRIQDNRSLSSEIVSNRKLPTKFNDIIGSPVTIVLNFTKEKLTTIDTDGFPNHYEPIYNSNFDKHKGSILLLTIRMFNHPKTMEIAAGSGNYFRGLRDKLRNSDQQRTRHLADICEFLINHPGIYSEDKFLNPTSSVKVVSIAEIDASELLHGEFVDADTGILYSLNKYSQIEGNPLTDMELYASDCLKDIITDGEIIVYINDPDDQLEPQYLNVAGNVFKVNKIKSKDRPRGLFLSSKNDFGDIITQTIPLEDIPTSEFVYSSKDAATNGANVKEKTSIEIAQLKSRLEATKLERDSGIIQQKQELEILKNNIEKEQAEFKVEMNKKRETLALELEEIKNKRDIESLTAKRDYEKFSYDTNRQAMSYKTNYEVDKYRRDSTLETIKTIGSVVAAGAGIVFLYSKFSK